MTMTTTCETQLAQEKFFLKLTRTVAAIREIEIVLKELAQSEYLTDILSDVYDKTSDVNAAATPKEQFLIAVKQYCSMGTVKGEIANDEVRKTLKTVAPVLTMAIKEEDDTKFNMYMGLVFASAKSLL